MSNLREQQYRFRRHYRLGMEFSGLERPRQWVGVVVIQQALRSELGVPVHLAALVAVEWDVIGLDIAPMLLAPAMNQQMWRNAATQENLATLEALMPAPLLGVLPWSTSKPSAPALEVTRTFVC